MPASIVRNLPRDPYKRLSLAVLRQSLIDAAAGQPVSISQLEPWAELAGIRRGLLRDAFRRLSGGDADTLLLVAQLGKPLRSWGTGWGLTAG